MPGKRIIALLLVPLAVLAGALPALRAETSVFLSGGHSYETRLAALEARDIVTGWTSNTRDRVLGQCFNLMIDPRFAAEGFATRQMVSSSCLAHSADARAQTPHDAFALTLDALVAARLGLPGNALNSLDRARAAAPYELWLASRRVVVGEIALGAMTSEQRESHMDDLRLMLSYRSGIAALAPLYLDEAPIRTRILEAVETLPESEQRQFLSVVRRTAFERSET